jgi:hypothetical protein
MCRLCDGDELHPRCLTFKLGCFNLAMVLRPNSQANIIRAVDRLGVTLAFDLFAERMLIGGPDGTAGRYLDDHEMRALRLRIDAEFGFLAQKELFFDVVLNEARKPAFHPVCDYLDGLKWMVSRGSRLGW